MPNSGSTPQKEKHPGALPVHHGEGNSAGGAGEVSDHTHHHPPAGGHRRNSSMTRRSSLPSLEATAGWSALQTGKVSADLAGTLAGGGSGSSGNNTPVVLPAGGGAGGGGGTAGGAGGGSGANTPSRAGAPMNAAGTAAAVSSASTVANNNSYPAFFNPPPPPSHAVAPGPVFAAPLNASGAFGPSSSSSSSSSSSRRVNNYVAMLMISCVNLPRVDFGSDTDPVVFLAVKDRNIGSWLLHSRTEVEF